MPAASWLRSLRRAWLHRRYVGGRRSEYMPVRRRGSSSAATLAWSEPLTALLRSAQSRVSSSRSLCKAAYEDPLRLPSESNAEPVITVAPQSAEPTRTAALRARAHRGVARHRRVCTGERFGRRGIRGCRAKPRAASTDLDREARGVSSEGHPQQEPAVWAPARPNGGRARTLPRRGHPPRRPRRDELKTAAMGMRGDLPGACRGLG